jgi:hypothetical protein
MNNKRSIGQTFQKNAPIFLIYSVIALAVCFSNPLSAQEAISLEDERTKQLQELGVLLPNPDAIREVANAEFAKLLQDQDPDTLEEIAKEANTYSNLVTKITEEYNDYLRDNSRYDFVTEEVHRAPIVDSLLNLDAEFKTYRNQAYLNLGLLAQADGKEMEAFLYFNDAFRLSPFDCPDGAEECVRYQAEQHMKSLLHIEGGSYVYWKK